MFAPHTISILKNGSFVSGRHKKALAIDNYIVGCRMNLDGCGSRIEVHLPFGGMASLKPKEFNELLPHLTFDGGIILTPLQAVFSLSGSFVTFRPANMPKAVYPLKRGYQYRTTHDGDVLTYHGFYYIAVVACHTDNSRSYLRIVYPQRPFHIFEVYDYGYGSEIVALRKVTPIWVSEYPNMVSDDLLGDVATGNSYSLNNGACCVRGIHRKLYGAGNLIVGISETPLDSSNYPVDLPWTVVNWDGQVSVEGVVKCKDLAFDVFLTSPLPPPYKKKR